MLNDSEFDPRQDPRYIKAKKRYAAVGWAAFVMVASSIVASILLGAAALVASLMTSFDPYGNPVTFWLLSFGPIYLVGIPLGLVLLRRVPRDSFTQAPLGVGNFFKYLMMCFCVSFVGGIVGNLLAGLMSFGEAVNPLDEMLETVDGSVMLATLVAAPVMEELFFRKFLLDRLTTFGETTAILFSALAFSMFHANLYQMVYAFGVGVIFAYVYIRTRRIRYTMALHFVFNFLGSVVGPLVLELAGDLDMADLGAILSGWSRMVPLMLYELFTLLAAAAGFVLLVINWRKARIYPGGDELPRGLAGSAVYGRAGVILFLIFCGLETLYTLGVSMGI